MYIIPQIETPVSENYLVFEENLINLLETIEKSGLNVNDKNPEKHFPDLILEQNFGVNGLVLCSDLIKRGCGGFKTAYAFSMRDKNRISILSDLITLKQIGIKDIIVSEGLHPSKTEFKTAKPVYDIDVLGFGLTLKSRLMSDFSDSNGNNDGDVTCNNIDNIGKFDFFNFGVVSGMTSFADVLKVKKLIKIGADRIILNLANRTDYSAENLEKPLMIDIINNIKSEKKEVFLYVKELSIGYSLEDFLKKVENLNIDGVIVKIIDEKANVFIHKALK